MSLPKGAGTIFYVTIKINCNVLGVDSYEEFRRRKSYTFNRLSGRPGDGTGTPKKRRDDDN